MRLTAFIIFSCCLHLSAEVNAQRISISGKDLTLKQVFSVIEKQTGFPVFFKKGLLNNTHPVTLSVTDKPLSELLQLVLKDQSLGFSVEGKTVVLFQKADVPLAAPEAPWSDFDLLPVKGIVRNTDGEFLLGVNILIKGSSIGATTDAKGVFELNAPEGSILVLSNVGYVTREIKVEGKPIITVIMERSTSVLDETQVIAYGKTSRRLSTGNVTTVRSEVIERQPVSNPLLALQGRVPGLFIEQASGIAGSAITVRIQGVNSLANGNLPFYVIDGVPYASESLPVVSGGNLISGGSPLTFINPATIESIDVLKDADATAIYGSRAANGAILITTKRGKAGQNKVDISLQDGIGQNSKKYKMMNTQQYLEMRREGYKNDGLAIPDFATTPTDTKYDVNGFWDINRYTDWQKVLFGGTAHYKDYQSSISGGNAVTQFFFGMGYHRETTLFPGDLSDRKVSAHFNINHRSLNSKFHFQVSGDYMDDVNRVIGNDLAFGALEMPPNAPALFLPDGSLNWEPLPNGNSSWTNPLTFLNLTYVAQTNNLITSSVVGYEILKGLEIKANVGYTKMWGADISKTPLKYFAPESRSIATSTSRNLNKSVTTWIAEPQLTYKKNIGAGVLDVLFGMTFQGRRTYALAVEGTGFPNDNQMDNLKSAANVSISNFVQLPYKYNAFFGKLNYNYQNKYQLNAVARRDGTSRFGSEDRFHTFYSIAGGWIFSQENFVKDHLPFLSFGKLRTSYGTTGSDQVGDYSYLNLYSNVSAPVAYQGSPGITPAGFTNPYLQWEQTDKLNFGLDLGFFKDRLLLGINYFRNRCGNQLVTTPLPSITGFTSIKQNLAAVVQNTGLELSLEAQPVIARHFKWDISLNMSLSTNKLLSFPDLDNSTYKDRYIIGKSVNISKMFDFAGVNRETGLYQFKTAQGGLTSTPATTDRTKLVNSLPICYGGIVSSISVYNFDLDLTFSYTFQNGINPLAGRISPGAGGLNGNQGVEVLDRWRDKDHPGRFERYTSNNSNPSFSAYTSSNAYLGDASYIRLKNANLSWSVPQTMVRKLGIQKLQVFVSGQNVLTFCMNPRFFGDPETRSKKYPQLRVLTFGMRASL